MAYSKIPESDKLSYHRRLEKLYNVNLSKLPQRTWLFEGELFQSPEFKQEGKPYIINRTLRAKYNHIEQPTQAQKWKSYNPLKKIVLLLGAVLTASTANTKEKDDSEREMREDEKGDFLALSDDELIFSETD